MEFENKKLWQNRKQTANCRTLCNLLFDLLFLVVYSVYKDFFSKNICRNAPKHHVSLGSTGGTEPPSARAAVLILCPRMS